MSDQITDCLMEMGRQTKLQDAIYRKTAESFGISVCAMWILYYLRASEQRLSQQDLTDLLWFPKQTIHSAVSGLAGKGIVILRSGTMSNKRKEILMTSFGEQFVDRTVNALLEAERTVVSEMSLETSTQFAGYQRCFNETLYKELCERKVLNDEIPVFTAEGENVQEKT